MLDYSKAEKNVTIIGAGEVCCVKEEPLFTVKDGCIKHYSDAFTIHECEN